jgi:uncharacterized protein with PQ loop repeat
MLYLLCDVCCVCCAGLTTLVEIIRERDSSSLYAPTVLVNLANATLWTIYGIFAINDVNVWVPNAVGIVLSFIQLFLCGIFPRKKAGYVAAKASSEGTTVDAANAVEMGRSTQNPMQQDN